MFLEAAFVPPCARKPARISGVKRFRLPLLFKKKRPKEERLRGQRTSGLAVSLEIKKSAPRLGGISFVEKHNKGKRNKHQITRLGCANSPPDIFGALQKFYSVLTINVAVQIYAVSSGKKITEEPKLNRAVLSKKKPGI